MNQSITSTPVLKRKIDRFLADWKARPGRNPLVIKGARQIGKTFSVMEFAKANYEHIVYINFILESRYRDIFADGYDVESVVKNITYLNPNVKIEPGKTLVFFDELQACPPAATSLKAFKVDGRYDVICSGSLMGINYQEIESNSVGYKEDVEMFSLDFEEFLWARGFSEKTIEDLLGKMLRLEPLGKIEFDVLSETFKDYMVVGGMPAVVDRFVSQNNFSGILPMQKQLLLDYREDITKYASGLDKAKILAVYNHISTFLARENKRFQITKIGHNARNRDYVGVIDWLTAAGIVNACYCLEHLGLPLKGNYNPDLYKLYYQDTGLFVASLDDEAQADLRDNRNFGTYKGALFENVIADILRKDGYQLYYYRNEKSTIEMDFFVRDAHYLIPVEVKASDNATKSLTKLTSGQEEDIRYGIKFAFKNIGFNGKFYTFPYFLAFLLRRFLKEHKPL